MNLFGDDKCTANYMTTGLWSSDAYDEAKKYGEIVEVCNNKKHNWWDIDNENDWTIDPNARYFHFCSNETVQGFEFHEFPWHKVPEGMVVACDMSSNFASKRIDWSKYGVVYAGAQKNVGPAGVCITIIRKDLIKAPRKDAPLMMDWALTQRAPGGMWNTPNCWSIYVCGVNIAYMLEQGGIEAMNRTADERSKIFYAYIDSTDGFYKNSVNPKYRSRMNMPFRIKNDPELELKFTTEAHANNLRDLKGHWMVGGCRASFYNGMTMEGVLALIEFMKKFHAENA